MREKPNLKAVSDDELLRRLSGILKQSRRVEADLVAHIAEVDARRLYAREAAPSMFAYCTEVLHLSEPEAYLRIAVARASRRHPMLLDMLADGRLHLSGIERLAPHLTEENHETVLKRAVHRSKRQIEELVAELAPRPAALATMRKLPARRAPEATADSGAASELRPAGVEREHHPDGVTRPDPLPSSDGVANPGPRPIELRPDGARPSPVRAAGRHAMIEAIAPARYRVRFDASAELRDKLERLQVLMRSSVPDGDLARIIEVAVTEKLERLEAKRFAKTSRPRKSLAETDTTPKSRDIPAAVRRYVYERDGGRCTYRDPHGRRCTKRHDLEYHHQKPFGRGGEHNPEVLTLHCETHNALRAEQDYGKEVMARFRRTTGRVSEAMAVYAISSREDPAQSRARDPTRRFWPAKGRAPASSASV